MVMIFNFLERTAKFFLLLSALVLIYWVLVNSIDVYQYIVVGAIYEILWLPFLVLLYTLPILNIVMFVKNKFSLKKIWPYALLINGLTVLYIYYMFS